MKSIIWKLLLLKVLILNGVNCINWKPGNWANSCDFDGNNLKSVNSTNTTCASLCSKTEACSHWSWNSGTCQMKIGYATKNMAVDTGDASTMCGITISYQLNVKHKSTFKLRNEFNSMDEITENWDQQYGNNAMSFWGNNELEFYTDQGHNIKVAGGLLTIEARIEDYAGLEKQYTSARLVSLAGFQYGFYELRAKLPAGRGTWPAFWLLASSNPLNLPVYGEIDVMEEVGYQPNIAWGTVHSPQFNSLKHNAISNSANANHASSTFHLYQLLWTPNNITMFLDNTPFLFYPKLTGADYHTWPFDGDYNIIINNAIGGDWGGNDGIDNSSFPNYYVIDYLRVYDI